MEAMCIVALPEDMLCQIVKHLDSQDKVRLQLECRKLNALLISPPQGESLWGEFHLPTKVRCSEDKDDTYPVVRRWLLRRIPYMTRISYDTSSANARRMLHTLIPCLSHLIAPAAELCVKFDISHTSKLLRGWADKQPEPAMMDFWRTFSERLTEAAFNVDWTKNREALLEPELLKQLTALTKLSFHVTGKSGQGFCAEDRLELPELKVLYVEGYRGRRLDLNCPNLTSLTLPDCYVEGVVSLQAPLQGLFVGSSGWFKIHTGFPLSNLMELVSLSMKCYGTHEETLFQALPLMQRLQTLDLGINRGELLQGLPHSLREVSLHFTRNISWDDAVIPMLQRLSNLKDLKILIASYSEYTLTELSSELMPFMETQRLRTFQLGPWDAWTPGSFKALGQFEVELMRAGSKLKLIY